MKNVAADKYRFIVAALIQNADGEYLLCRKPDNAGVFPGQWGFPGGGIEENETLEEALEREVQEEVGLEISGIEPLFFWDDLQPKYKNGESIGNIYMVYHIFRAVSASKKVQINDEFEAFHWVPQEELARYDVSPPTQEVFERLGLV